MAEPTPELVTPEEPVTAETPTTSTEVPKGKKALAAFKKKLAKYGLIITKAGKIRMSGAARKEGWGDRTDLQQAGTGGDPELMQLLQKGWNQFGFTNDFYDPQRVVWDKGVGNFVDLGTGMYGDQSVSDVRLSHLQSTAGYDPAVGQQYYQNLYAGIEETNGFVPWAYRSPENYQTYLSNARKAANEEAGRQGQGPGPSGQEVPGGKTPPMTDFNSLNDEDLFAVSDTVNQMLQARKQRAAARTFQSDFFDLTDFESE